jgi:pimeloyl-ACP methyl ester carboxylesterase|tara:strand:+ start:1319 stop:2206 length:888 start_codon:yes stop_codon:yes gene_type:complete
LARWDKEGNRESIPNWFWEAIDVEPVTKTVEVEECDVSYRHYEAIGKPGMLLIHGMNAHSRWWDFIAPQLLDRYQVAAMDLTGMGDSDYRYEYSSNTYADEILAVLDDAKFGTDSIVVAHSFGGYMAVRAANKAPDRFKALVMVDSGIRHPDDPVPEQIWMSGARSKIYPDKETALNRFRVQPPQPCDNEFLLQYIARNSLMPVDGGWTWKFDEDLLTSLTDAERKPEEFQALTTTLGVIFGADSELFSRRTLEYMQELIAEPFLIKEIANAQHHLFLDQPQAFVESLLEMCQKF